MSRRPNDRTCMRGHKRTAKSTYVLPSNPKVRVCRICRAIYKRNRVRQAMADQLRGTSYATPLIVALVAAGEIRHGLYHQDEGEA